MGEVEHSVVEIEEAKFHIGVMLGIELGSSDCLNSDQKRE